MQLVYDNPSVVDAVVADVNKRDGEVDGWNMVVHWEVTLTTWSSEETEKQGRSRLGRGLGA